MKIKWVLLGLAAAVSFGASVVKAADNSFRPLIEVGSGVSSGIVDGELTVPDVLLHVGFNMHQITGNGGDSFLGPEQFVLAKISADAAFGVDGNPEAVRVLDIRLVPVSSTVALENGDAHVVMGTLDLIPMQLSRNVYVDNEFSVKIDLVGARLGTKWVLGDNAALYLELVGKLLGYKMRNHMDESLGNFSGFHVGELGTELGALFSAGEVGLRLFFGAGADLALGSSGGQFAVQSDMGVYGGIAADLTRTIQKLIPGVGGFAVFIKGAYDYLTDSGNSSSVGSGVILGGFSVRF